MPILIGRGDISLWFWLAFPWWLPILSICFSCICWLFTFLLLKTVWSFRPFLNWISFFVVEFFGFLFLFFELLIHSESFCMQYELLTYFYKLKCHYISIFLCFFAREGMIQLSLEVEPHSESFPAFPQFPSLATPRKESKHFSSHFPLPGNFWWWSLLAVEKQMSV